MMDLIVDFFSELAWSTVHNKDGSYSVRRLVVVFSLIAITISAACYFGCKFF